MGNGRGRVAFPSPAQGPRTLPWSAPQITREVRGGAAAAGTARAMPVTAGTVTAAAKAAASIRERARQLMTELPAVGYERPVLAGWRRGACALPGTLAQPAS